MNIHVLKTDLQDTNRVHEIGPILNLHPAIYRWNGDIEDIDTILKVESAQNLKEEDMIQLLKQYGIYSESLTDYSSDCIFP